MLQALEELAVSYDCKDKEIQQSLTAKLVLQEEVDKLQVRGGEGQEGAEGREGKREGHDGSAGKEEGPEGGMRGN